MRDGLNQAETISGIMSMEDPFFVVKGEVQKEVQSAETLHHRWRVLEQAAGRASKEEVDWTTNELRNCLRSIEWDLEDLEETNALPILVSFPDHLECIVQSNPNKFSLDETELKNRKIFITNTRLTVQAMKDQMTGVTAASTDRQNQGQVSPGSIWQPGPHGQRLDRQLENTSSHFLNEQHAQQKLMAEQQNEHLQLMSGTIAVLKNMSEQIGLELDEQATMLDDFSHEVDNAQSRLDNVMKKLATVSHMTSDRRQWSAIWILLAVLFVIILLFFIL